MIQTPYGWRGKVGLIYIASAYAMEVEFSLMAPPGVTTHTTRIALSDQPEQFSVKDLQNLETDLLQATKLLAQAPLQSIAFGCTSGSFVNGLAYDVQIIEQMEQLAGIPCTTTATSVLQALKELKIDKVAIATPYSEEVNSLAHEYFTSGGLTVTNMTGLGIMNDYTISELDNKAIYEMAKKTYTKDAEALFISCTGLATAPLVHALEEDLQVPVITSNQATFWHALRIADIGCKLRGYGQLFQQ